MEENRLKASELMELMKIQNKLIKTRKSYEKFTARSSGSAVQVLGHWQKDNFEKNAASRGPR
jgi:hypothetical protein